MHIPPERCGRVSVGVQGPHGGVREENADIVPVLFRNLPEVGDERGGQGIPRDDVHTPPHGDGRGGGEIGQQPPQLRLDFLPSPAPGAGDFLSGESEEITALVVVETRGLGECLRHGCGGVDAALLKAGVVVGGEGRELGGLFPPQTRHPTRARARETVTCPPDEEHWHGATPDRFMQHLAMWEGTGDDRPETAWLEKVTAEQCGGVRTRGH